MVDMPDGCVFRPMQTGDVRTVLEIIEDHDEDDFAWASETYHESLEGQFVIEDRGRVVGVTGGSYLEGTDRSFAISWTYLQRQFIGRGYGRALLESLLEKLKAEDARKLFVETSDYIDPEDGDIYRDAREAYRAVGFQEELRQANYYDQNENLIMYGLHLQQRSPAPHEANMMKILLTDIDEIPECEGAYWLNWELDKEGSDISGFELIVNQVREWEGRAIFMHFPSDVQAVEEFMTRARFRKDGQLMDFYEDGVDQIRYRMDIV